MFKYSLNILGSREDRSKFTKELEKLGYKRSPTFQGSYDKGMLRVGKRKEHGGIEKDHYGEVSTTFYGDSSRDYVFNISFSQDYNIALAIASLRDDDKIGIYNIVRNYDAHRSNYTTGKGTTTQRVLEISPKLVGFKADPIFNPEAAGDFYYTLRDRKTNNGCWTELLTPDEIIAYYRSTAQPEFKLPEKWYVVRDENNSKVLNKWNNDRYPGAGNNAFNDNEAYMFSDKSYDTLKYKVEGYTEITFEQFKKYVMKTGESGEKELIGYKLLHNLPDVEAGTVGAKNSDGSWEFKTVSGAGWGIRRYSQTDINREIAWFEPVYKEVVKEVTLSVGNPKMAVTVRKGSVSIARISGLTDIQSIRQLLNGFNPLPDAFRSYVVVPYTLWIGCADGTAVTKTDVQEVISAYEKINK